MSMFPQTWKHLTSGLVSEVHVLFLGIRSSYMAFTLYRIPGQVTRGPSDFTKKPHTDRNNSTRMQLSGIYNEEITKQRGRNRDKRGCQPNATSLENS